MVTKSNRCLWTNTVHSATPACMPQKDCDTWVRRDSTTKCELIHSVSIDTQELRLCFTTRTSNRRTNPRISLSLLEQEIFWTGTSGLRSLVHAGLHGLFSHKVQPRHDADLARIWSFSGLRDRTSFQLYLKSEF